MESTSTSDSLRNESQPQARGNGQELLKKTLPSKANILQFCSFSLPTVFLFKLFPCLVEHQHRHTQRYPHRQAFYFRFITEAIFPFYCESIPKVAVYLTPGVFKLKLWKAFLCKSDLLVFRCLNIMCWSQKDSFGGTSEHRLASKLEHVHWESCERFIWPRAGCYPAEPGWPLPWTSDTFTAKAQPHVTASTSARLFFPPLCNSLDCIRGNDGFGKAKRPRRKSQACAQEGLQLPCFPRAWSSALSRWTPAPRPRANTLWDPTCVPLLSSIFNFRENGTGLRFFPSRHTVIWFWW